MTELHFSKEQSEYPWEIKYKNSASFYYKLESRFRDAPRCTCFQPIIVLTYEDI